MGWTKRQLVNQAFEEIGLASYTFDLLPEQLQSALRRLDAMMATWNGRGIRLGYLLPSNPLDSDIDEESGVPDISNEAIYTNLAVRLAPSFGKQLSLETKVIAKTTYDLLLSKAAVPSQMQLPDTLPSGAGNKPWRRDNPFISPPSDNLLAGSDGELNF